MALPSSDKQQLKDILDIGDTHDGDSLRVEAFCLSETYAWITEEHPYQEGVRHLILNSYVLDKLKTRHR